MNEDREVLTTSGTYPWPFVTQIFHNGQPSQLSFHKVSIYQFKRLHLTQYIKKKKKYNIIFNKNLLKQLHCNIKCYLSCLSV